MTLHPGPHVPVPASYPLAQLEPGDRFELHGLLLEVVRRTTGAQRSLHVVPVAPGGAPELPAASLPAFGSADGVRLAADRARPGALGLHVWGGGASGGPVPDTALDVPLTVGGGVLLQPSFQPGEGGSGPGFHRLRAVVASAGTCGDLARLASPSRDRAGLERQWDLLGARLRLVGALDRGLDRAGRALADLAARRPDVDDGHAWALALGAHEGLDLDPAERRALLRLAPTFAGGARDLVWAARAVVSPAP